MSSRGGGGGDDDGVLPDAVREFAAAFGGISRKGRRQISEIRRKDPDRIELDLSAGTQDVWQFGDLAWKLMGRYIAGNNCLRSIHFKKARLTDNYMACLFSELPKCTTMTRLNLQQNPFGRAGVESMASFLRESSNLTDLSLSNNSRLDNECFTLILDALNGGRIQKISMDSCDITDITSLQDCTLPSLEVLSLSRNKIHDNILSLETFESMEVLLLDWNDVGLEGCRTVASLLRNKTCSLKWLGLESSSMCDETVEVLAQALKFNTALKALTISNNSLGHRIGRRGLLALLKLLNDMSSLGNTFNSNHSLCTLGLPQVGSGSSQAQKMMGRIKNLLHFNRTFEGRPKHQAGQIKVVRYQLDSKCGSFLCQVQGIEYSFGSVVEGIDSFLLPNVLALVGRILGRNDLFKVLVATAPGLVTLIDKKAMMENVIGETAAQIAETEAQIAVLAAKKNALEERLTSLKQGVENMSKDDGQAGGCSKRMRI